MNPSEEERLAALERQQQEILSRLERLEQLGRGKASAKAKAPPPPRPVARLREGFETRMGLMWVNRVGVVTLVLGAAFFFKYAVESGWIGPLARVLVGLAAGAAALFFSERTARGAQQVWSQGLAAAGLGILYLTFYAAFVLYHLVPQGLAFVLMALTTAVAVWLALRYNSLALALLGLAGGFLTPLLLTGSGQSWFALGYVLLLGVGVRYLLTRRPWTSLAVVALVGTAWVYIQKVPSPPLSGRRPGYTAFALAFFALFAGMGPRYIGAAAQVIAALIAASIWPAPVWAFGAVMLVLAAGGLVVADRRGWPLAALAGFWPGYWFWSFDAQHDPMASFQVLTAAFVLFFAWLPWRVRARHAAATLQDLMLVALNAGFYFAAAYVVLAPEHPAWLGALALLLAACHAALGWQTWGRDRRAALFAAGVAWAFLVLAAPAQFSGYRVTAIWALEAAALAWTSSRFAEPRAMHAALGVFALVLMRLLFVDRWMYATPSAYSVVANARFLTFSLAAGCLWAAARWAAAPRSALAAYLGGHFALLWGLGLEVAGWAARTASPANLPSVESAALSILLAGYALVLVGVGVFTGTVLNRVLGLGLIALVVLKLYLHDVWSLGLFYRMAAFAILGTLLLAMSYLYSRFRESLGRWWNT